MVKNRLPIQEPQEMRFRSLGQEDPLDWEDPLDEEMATHSSILAWEIPWTEERGELQSTGLQWVRHDLLTEQLKENHPNEYKQYCIFFM